MKKTTILFTILFSCNLIFAQIRWNYLFPDENIGSLQGSIFEKNDTLITFGSTITYDSIVPYVSMSNAYFSPDGNLIKNVLLNSTDSCFVISPETYNDENYISLCGEVRYPINPTKPYGVFALFYDKQTQHIKSFVFPHDPNELLLAYANARRINLNKYIFLLTNHSINMNGTSRLKIIETDSNFTINRIKYLQVNSTSLRGRSITYKDNFYYLSSTSQNLYTNFKPSNCIIYKLDTLLNVVKTYNSNDGRHYLNRDMLFLPNGDFIISGVYVDTFVPPEDLWQRKYLLCFDQDLNIKWTKYFGSRCLETNVFKIKLGSDGNIYGCGGDVVESILANGDTIGAYGGCIFKFSPDGDSIWMRKYQGIDGYPIGDLNYLFDVTELNDGGYAACGRSIGFNPYMERGWVLRVDENGCLNEACTNSVKEAENFTDFMLYPNPANEVLNVTNTHEIASYQIFEHSGKLITQGNTFPIPISPLANGLYFLQLTTKQNQIINHKFLKQ